MVVVVLVLRIVVVLVLRVVLAVLVVLEITAGVVDTLILMVLETLRIIPTLLLAGVLVTKMTVLETTGPSAATATTGKTVCTAFRVSSVIFSD